MTIEKDTLNLAEFDEWLRREFAKIDRLLARFRTRTSGEDR